MPSRMRPSGESPASPFSSSAFHRRPVTSKTAPSLLLRASSGEKMRKLRAFWFSFTTSRMYCPSTDMSSADTEPGAGTSTAYFGKEGVRSSRRSSPPLA